MVSDCCDVSLSFRPVIEVSPMRVTVAGPHAFANPSEGYCVALMDDSQVHPAKRLVRSAYGPNVPTALATLRAVVEQDFWLTDAAKDAAAIAIDARQEVSL